MLQLISAAKTACTIKNWTVKAGDAVAKGAALCTVSQGKMTRDITAKWPGTVAEILAPEGTAVPGGEPICSMEVSEEDLAAAEAAAEETVKTVAVIGGGPGGYVAAIRAAQLGGKVTLIEKKRIGGTCLNEGCIPTKALLHSAELYRNAKNGASAGVVAKEVSLDWDGVQGHRRKVVDKLVGGVASLLEANGVETVKAAARFKDAHTLVLTDAEGKEKELTADSIIIAAGSAPVIPPIPGLAEAAGCVDSTGALEFPEKPESLVVIGGGVIGIELACAYNAFGTKVTVVEMLDRLLPPMDLDLTVKAQKIMEDAGIAFSLGTKVTGAESTQEGVRVFGEASDGTKLTFEAGKVLVAVGRRSNTASLALENAGIEAQRGIVTVDDRMQTGVPGVYAIGDCTGRMMLAHAAMAMGETAAENAMGKRTTYSEKVCPSCVYMMPEFAGVGSTEEQLKAKNINYKAGVFPIAANGKSVIMEEPEGEVKILADARSGKLLGIHILGPRATDLIGEAAAYLSRNAYVEDIANTLHAHPTVTEALREAALAFQDRAIHFK
ncbi:MAG: dihydrolipoyl dehydrogenase [Firmicutes bacterium]|nr:dihydrolipoyl dehydrogenase [Bacillota bacterium]